MKKNTIVSKSDTETRRVGKEIIFENKNVLREKALVIMLSGNLGAGKTVFVKGVGSFLGVRDIISPTFVISCEYDIYKEYVKRFYHIDLYRLDSKLELNDIGLGKAISPGNIICIEWGEKGRGFIQKLKLRARIINVRIDHIDKNKRKIIITNN